MEVSGVFLNNIIKKENIEIDDFSKEIIIRLSNNSIRILLNYIEKMKLLDIPITSNIIDRIGSNISYYIFDKYTSNLLTNNLNNSIKIINELYIEGYSVMDIYDNYFQYIKFSFIHNDKIYFVEDNRYQDARLMEVDYKGIINENTTNITVLDGINNIEKIEFDRKNKQILILAGSLASELFKYDYNFTKLNNLLVSNPYKF